MGGSDSKCESGEGELSCNSGEVLNITKVTCWKESCIIGLLCKCNLSCDDDCDSQLDVVKQYCQGKSSCTAPEDETELCQGNRVLNVIHECMPESTTSVIFSTVPDWLSKTSANGSSAHKTSVGQNVITTKLENNYGAKGSALSDPKIIASAAAAGIVLILILVLISIIIKRRHKKSTGHKKQTVTEEKHNELYELEANYTDQNGDGCPTAYSTVADVTNEVGESQNVEQNAYSYADETDRDDPTQRSMTENILYGER